MGEAFRRDAVDGADKPRRDHPEVGGAGGQGESDHGRTAGGQREVPVLLGLPRAGHGDKFRVLDPVGADGGDVDAPEEQLVVERLGVAVQKGLRGGVDPQAGEGLEGGGGADL